MCDTWNIVEIICWWHDVQLLYPAKKNIRIAETEVAMIKNEWLPLMPERYNFSFSKKLHNKKLPSFSKFLKTISI